MTDFDDGAAPDSIDERLAEAARLMDEERIEEALDLLTSLEDEYREHPGVLCLLGLVMVDAGASESGYDYFRRSLAAQPQDPFILVMLGRALARYDDPDAEGVLRLAAVTAPEVAVTRLEYGAYLAREGIFDLAMSELRAARELDPENPRIAREEGVAHLLVRNGDAGIEALERAVTLGPDDSEVRLLLGLALVASGRLGDAAEELVRAAREMPGDAEAQLAAALAASSQGWEDEAWASLSRAEVAPEPPDADLLREVEEALAEEDGGAGELLAEEVAPPLLRERLLERG